MHLIYAHREEEVSHMDINDPAQNPTFLIDISRLVTRPVPLDDFVRGHVSDTRRLLAAVQDLVASFDALLAGVELQSNAEQYQIQQLIRHEDSMCGPPWRDTRVVAGTHGGGCT